MSFLAPLFFAGLAAIAIPIIVHLIQRERKRVIEFPSLMFVRKIPYQSVRRRRIRHWPLLLLRALAIALVVAAFARPFFKAGGAIAAAAGGNREVVLLLDQSASMGYGDRWQQARDAAKRAIEGLGTSDRATLVLFSRNAEENLRATSDRGRLSAAIDAAKIGAGATRYGPALKLAESILARSSLPRHEVVVISDFQKSGWSGAEDVHFAEGTTVTTLPVDAPPSPNISVPSVTLSRTTFSGQDRLTITAGIANKGPAPAAPVPVVLEIDGRPVDTQQVTLGADASTSVSFAPFTLSDPNARGMVHAGTDPLPADNAFYFVVTPNQPVPVLIVNGGDRPETSFYLSRALSVGTSPVFEPETIAASRVAPSMIAARSVVVLNDTVVPPGLAGGVLKQFVERGGGLLLATGARATWPTTEAELLPGKLGAPVDRSSGRGATLGFLDYSHPVFEVFKTPRSGDFSSARVRQYRAIQPAATDRVLARFDDGAVAAVERRVGTGRVIGWASSLDDTWTDLVLKPVYLPLVQQMVKYLARYEQPSMWRTAGQAVDLATLLKSRADRVVLAPAGERTRLAAADSSVLELSEQGIYEIREATNTSGRPDRIAVNIDPTESDLTPLDPQELVAAVTGKAAPGPQAASAATEMSPADLERSQSVWWYLLFAGFLLLGGETWLSNHLSRNERFL